MGEQCECECESESESDPSNRARVQKVVVELDGRVRHLEPADVDADEEIVWEGRNLAGVDHEVGYLVAAEALDGVPEHLRVLDVPAVGHHLHLRLALERRVRAKGVARQVPGEPAGALSALGGSELTWLAGQVRARRRRARRAVRLVVARLVPVPVRLQDLPVARRRLLVRRVSGARVVRAGGGGVARVEHAAGGRALGRLGRLSATC